jgi:hypothetical protein
MGCVAHIGEVGDSLYPVGEVVCVTHIGKMECVARMVLGCAAHIREMGCVGDIGEVIMHMRLKWENLKGRDYRGYLGLNDRTELIMK